MAGVRCAYCNCVLGERADADLVALVQGHFDLVCMRPVALAAARQV